MADFRKWSMVHLKEELSRLGLKTSGSKADLLMRLETHNSKYCPTSTDVTAHLAIGARDLSEYQRQQQEELDQLKMKLEILKTKESIRNTEHRLQQPANMSSSGSQPSDGMNEMLKMFKESMEISRLPGAEPEIFYGDPLKYGEWKHTFNLLIEKRSLSAPEKLVYLKKYLGGKALECVSGYLLLSSDDNAYLEARQVLEERFGSQYAISDSFRDKLESWPKIQAATNGNALRQYADFLRQCVAAKITAPGLNILDDPRILKDLVKVLPAELIKRWSRTAGSYRLSHDDYPSFEYYSEFVSAEASIACDTVTSLDAIYGKSKTTKPIQSASKESKHMTSVSSSSEPRETEGKYNCHHCQLNSHDMSECRKFKRLLYKDKQQFIRKLNLCFACLLSDKHRMSECPTPKKCSQCDGKHPTCLHRKKKQTDEQTTSKPDEKSVKATEVICSKVYSQPVTPQLTSMIIPVYVSTTEDPSNEILTYALIDSQSDTSFVLNSTVEALHGQTATVRLQISTMTSKTEVTQSKVYKNLLIRGYYSSK